MRPEDRWPIRGGERRILQDGAVGLDSLDPASRRAVAESIAADAEPGLRAMLTAQRQNDMLSGATTSARESVIPTRSGEVHARTSFNNGRETMVMRPRARLERAGSGPINDMRIVHILGQTQYDPRLTAEEKSSGLKFLWAAADRTFYDNIVNIFKSEGLYFRKPVPTSFVRSDGKRTATMRGEMEVQIQVQVSTLFVYITLHIASAVQEDKKDQPYEVCENVTYTRSVYIFTSYVSAYYGDTTVQGETLEIKYPDGEFYFVSSEFSPREFVTWRDLSTGETTTAWGSTFFGENTLQPSGRLVVPRMTRIMYNAMPSNTFGEGYTVLAKSGTKVGDPDPNTRAWLELWGSEADLYNYDTLVSRPALTYTRRVCHWVYPQSGGPGPPR